jgi:hypothetical protein
MSCLIFTLWALEFLAHMYRFLVTLGDLFDLPDIYTLHTEMLGPYVQIVDE